LLPAPVEGTRTPGNPGNLPEFDVVPETHTHTPFNGPLSRTTWVSRYQKGKTNLDFTEARDSEWHLHQLGHVKSASRSRQITMPAPHHSVFLQAGCPSCCPTNSVKALKAINCLQKIVPENTGNFLEFS